MDKRTLKKTLAALQTVYQGHEESDAVKAAAEELYFAFGFDPQTVWQAPRQQKNFQAMLARHMLNDWGESRALALALERSYGLTADHWQAVIEEYTVAGILGLLALPPAVRGWWIDGADGPMPAGYSLEPEPPPGRAAPVAQTAGPRSDDNPPEVSEAIGIF
jgi:hypothetical protein